MADLPEFHYTFRALPKAVNMLLTTQIQSYSTVTNGVIYEWRTNGGDAEATLDELLSQLMPLVDDRFGQDFDAYWTLQIRIARMSTQSKWHQYAISLPEGITTIVFRSPSYWITNKPTAWQDPAERSILVY